MKVLDGTRMIKTISSQRTCTYELVNNRIGKNIILNYQGANILRKIHQGKRINKKYNDFILNLSSLGIIVKGDDSGSDVYLCDNKRLNLPLTCLNIELTNKCNLRCIHCYGDFGHNSKENFITLKWIRENLHIFDELNIKTISITGGESTVNPEFTEICLELLKHGFELCIFTNGLNALKLKDFLLKTKDYYYKIKVSLDGFKETHDHIRGINGCYDRVMEALDEISKYSNVELYISTVLMKCNLNEIDSFSKWVTDRFPKAIHTVNLVFPTNICKNEAFAEEEFDIVYSKYPQAFSISKNEKKNKHRCSGGITQCTLSPNGDLKICNSAEDDIFKFSNNVFEKGLSYSWIHCGKNIKFLRKEKNHNTKDCKKCESIKECKNTDCRIIAYKYFKDNNRSNPITCFTIKRRGISNEKMDKQEF